MARAALGTRLLATNVLATLLFARTGHADKPHQDVRLMIEDCTPGVLNLREAYAAATLELGLADSSGNATTPGSHVELNAALACEHGVKAKLTLKTADQSASRVVPLDDVRTKDRPRVLALALAELVRAEWRWVTTGKTEETAPPPGDERHTSAGAAPRDDSASSSAAAAASAGSPDDSRSASDSHAENGGKPSASPPPASVPTAAVGDVVGAPDTPDASPGAEHGLALEVLGRARALFEGSTFVYGVAAGARWQRWSASVEALFGRTHGALGTANVGSADARVGYELWRATQARWFFAIEPSIAGGVTWVNGTGATPEVKVSDATAFYGDARLAFRTEFRSPSLSPTLCFEAGRALGLAAQENGSTIAVTGGWFVGGALGFVVRGAL